MAEDDDIDIYSDLEVNKSTSTSAALHCIASAFDTSIEDEVFTYNELNNLENETRQLRSENERLRKENEDLVKTLTMRDKQLKILKNNISSLYKTAKMELDRKQQQMNELQNKYDQLVFRRIDQTKLNDKVIQETQANENNDFKLSMKAVSPPLEASRSCEKRSRSRDCEGKSGSFKRIKSSESKHDRGRSPSSKRNDTRRGSSGQDNLHNDKLSSQDCQRDSHKTSSSSRSSYPSSYRRHSDMSRHR